MFRKTAARPAGSGAFICLLGFILLTAGCASRDKPVVLKMAELPFEGSICRIAVLPLTNQTNYKMGETLFSRVFVSELIDRGNYLVAQEGDVRGVLNQMRVLPGKSLSSEQVRALGDRLNVQIVISGAVLEMRDKTEGSSRNLDPALAVVMRIMEASSGRTLWVTYNRAEGEDYRTVMHFGMISSVAALAKEVAAEIMEAWHKKGFKICAE